MKFSATFLIGALCAIACLSLHSPEKIFEMTSFK